MEALIPLLVDAAPAVVGALGVGFARGFGGVVGRAAGNTLSSNLAQMTQPQTQAQAPDNSGQKRMVVMIDGKPVY